MANFNLPPQICPEDIQVDEEVYTVSAMPATAGLQFMEKYQESMDSGKADLSLMKQVICKYVSKDNKAIDEKRFDVVFARRYVHLQKLFQEVLKYNFEEVFQEPGTED